MGVLVLKEQNIGFRFEGLRIWHQAREFIDIVYKITEMFPRKEDFALTSQLNRAAYSIGLNIAEGSGRDSSKEFIQFLSVAKGSLFEVVSGFAFALGRSYISKEQYQDIYEKADYLGKSINNFKRTLSQKGLNKSI